MSRFVYGRVISDRTPVYGDVLCAPYITVSISCYNNNGLGKKAQAESHWMSC